MDITTFLAQLWGPVILAVGIGVFLSRAHYVRLYRDLEKNALAGLCFGIIAMAAGILQVRVHAAWDTLPQVVVSLLGWGLLIKGTLFVIAPTFVDRMGDRWAKLTLIPLAGGFMLLVGAYLTWIGYLAG